MNFEFDIYDQLTTPNMYLCNPDGKELYTLEGYKDLAITLRYNAISELSFIVPKDSRLTYYDWLRPKRLVRVERVGVFMLTECREVSDGISKSKEIVAQSLEVELNYKSITLLEGTYKFYDAVNLKDSLLGKIMEYLPNWTLGTVESDLWNIHRTFDLATQTIYGFLMGDVENAYECVFEFDTFKRQIHAKTARTAVRKTNIFLSHENVVKDIQIEENSSELITCLEVFGGNDLSINLVNPLGSTKMYNFSYYKNTSWMSQGLIDALNVWEKKIESNQGAYANALSSLKTTNAELVVLKSKLVDLNGEYVSLEGAQKTRIEQGLPYEDIWEQMVAKKQEITNKETEIAAKELQIKNIQQELKNINLSLAFLNSENFTAEQLKELDAFLIEQVYQNEFFITNDSMTPDQVQDVSQTLYNQAKGVLEKLSQPTYTFRMNSLNFMAIKAYEYFTKQLTLGSQLTIELEEGKYAYPVLLELVFSFGEGVSNLSMGFGNRLRLNSDDFKFSELFGDTVKTSNQVSFDSEKWNQYGKDKGTISDFINNALDASKNAVINADNQEIVINANGLKGRRFNDDTGDYDPEQIWMTSKNLVFSKDSFKTVETAIGEILLPSGQTSYGIIAQAIIGKLLVSSELHIENENNTFKVDGNGVTIINGNILLTDKDNTTKPIEDVLDGRFTKVYEDMAEMEEAIKDGEIVIFYESRKPTSADGKEGDMWYDTTVINGIKKNEAYIKRKGNWELIKDSEITKALGDAHIAQQTADGKITTYWQTTAPTGLQAKDVGDLWFDTDNGNKQYRWDGSKWVDVRDDGIGTSSNIIVNSLPNKNDEKFWSFDKTVGGGNYYHVEEKFAYFYQRGANGKRPHMNSKNYDCEPNTYYTLSFDCRCIGMNMRAYLLGSKEKKPITSIGGTYDFTHGSEVISTNTTWKRYTYTFKTDVEEVSFYVRLTAESTNSNEPSMELQARNIKLEKGKVATPWSRSVSEESFYEGTDANDKINNVINPDTGDIRTDKLIGSIEAGKNNIDIINNATTKAMKLNEVGLLIANSKSGNNWQWKTAISADGIVADYIKANGTITGCNLVGGTLNIGNNTFKVTNTGACTASNLSITGGSISIGSNFKVDASGSVTASSLAISGGNINIADKFKVDSFGNLTTAGSLTLGGNINMTGSVTWASSNSPVKVQYSVSGTGSWHETFANGDKFARYSYDGGKTWTGALKIVGDNGTNGTNGSDAHVPSYIKETYIDSTTVKSPTLEGNIVNGGIITGGVIQQLSPDWENWGNCRLEGGRLQLEDKSGDYLGAVMGDDTDKKMWIEGYNALKLVAYNGNISINPMGKDDETSSGTVYVYGRLVVRGGQIVDENNNPLMGSAKFG